MERLISTAIVLFILVLFLPWDRMHFSRNLKKSLHTKKRTHPEHKKRIVIVLEKAYKHSGLNAKKDKRDKIGASLVAANLDKKLSIDAFLGMKLCLPFLFAVFLVFEFIFEPTAVNAIRLVAVPVVSYFVPDNVVRNKISARKKNIQKELPSIMNTLAIITDSGLGFYEAIRHVCTTRAGSFIEELRLMQIEMEMGIMQRDALYNLAERCQVNEVYAFVFALVQAHEKGVSGISSTLRSQSDEMWKIRKSRAEEIGEKASSKLFLALLVFVLPAFLIFVLGPAVIDIMKVFS